MRIGIIGAGNVGSAVGVLLQAKGHEIIGIASRSSKSANQLAKRLGIKVLRQEKIARIADVVLLTVNDGAIADVATKLSYLMAFHPGQVVVHFSGSLPAGILAPVRNCGAFAVSIHPLQSCAGIEVAINNLPRSVFSIEGDNEAFSVAEKLISDLEGKHFYINGKDKMLYHAAAVFISNYAVTLADISRRMLERLNVPTDIGMEGMLTLLKGTVANIDAFGAPGALTGPIARGDSEVVRQHLQQIALNMPELTQVYTEMAKHTVEVALAKGSISGEQADELSKVVKGDLGRGNYHENYRNAELCVV